MLTTAIILFANEITHIYPWLILVLFSTNALVKPSELSDTHLSICGDSIDWEPYTYVQDEEVKGFDLDVLNEILPKHRITFDFTMSSWSRCLKGGRAGDFQVAVSATYSDERAKHFLYTTWYYATTPSYLYRKSEFKNGLKITDLNAYKVSMDTTTAINQSPSKTHARTRQRAQRRKCDVILAGNKKYLGYRLHR